MSIIRVGVGSRNPAKTEAVKEAFKQMGYEVILSSIPVPSGVSSQPFSDEETMRGAVNRANAVMQLAREEPLDFAVGLEGGVVETPCGYFVCNWGAICDREGKLGIGGGIRIQLPDTVVRYLKKGAELGEAMDVLSQKRETGKQEGAIGILTGNAITRRSMFRDVVICAFARFQQSIWYEK
ncbi:MAG: inosine/xanthosine triphosphatase [Bacillaceae bacterium]|nr:inosine/xanthosine triphosphatase [Bacillaceae bacterium]